MSLPHLVYVGHIGGCTGLGTVASVLLDRLAPSWRITVVSLGHPPDYQCPYRLLHGIFANDRLGKFVTRKLCEQDPPDLIVPYFDPAPILDFLPFIPAHIPVVAYMPVDSCNVKEAHQLNRLAHGIFLTQFGLNEARLGGYTGAASVIGHGVDLTLYQPQDKHTARAKLRLPQDIFLFGAVNRNQLRKRLDLTLYSFQAFLQRTGATNAYLYCHCAAQGEGWDLPQLAQYLGIAHRVLFPPPHLLGVAGMPEALMPYVYSALDVQVSTSQGEGFGLTTLEGLACGIPQIIPDFAALGEWASKACMMVPATSPMVTTASTNLVAWCVDYREMAHSMAIFYELAWARDNYRVHGLQYVQQPQFSWDVLAAQFQEVLAGALSQKAALHETLQNETVRASA